MAVITNTVYQCDCCKRKSNDSSFNDGSQEGKAIIKIGGHDGALCMGRDWGGSNYQINIEVCFDCSEKIRSFIRSITVREQSK